MAEVLVRPGDDLSKKGSPTMRQLKRVVAQEGVVKALKEARFHGALTKGQKRREKKNRSRRRCRRDLRVQQQIAGRERLDQNDEEKFLAQSWPLYNDASLATGPETWNEDLVLVPLKVNFAEEVRKRMEREEQKRLDEERARCNPDMIGFRFGESRKRTFVFSESFVPSVHSCVVGLREIRGKIRIAVVRAVNIDGTEREHFEFPGGNVKLAQGESPEQGGNRENVEETGLIAETLTPAHRIGEPHVKDLHTFIGYLAMIVDGKLKKGEEIVELLTPTFSELQEMANKGMLSIKHLDLFRRIELALANLVGSPEPQAMKGEV